MKRNEFVARYSTSLPYEPEKFISRVRSTFVCYNLSDFSLGNVPFRGDTLPGYFLSPRDIPLAFLCFFNRGKRGLREIKIEIKISTLILDIFTSGTLVDAIKRIEAKA